MRHEDLVENTTSWLREFQARFNLRTRPGFPIEARAPHARTPPWHATGCMTSEACRLLCACAVKVISKPRNSAANLSSQALALPELMRWQEDLGLEIGTASEQHLTRARDCTAGV